MPRMEATAGRSLIGGRGQGRWLRVERQRRRCRRVGPRGFGPGRCRGWSAPYAGDSAEEDGEEWVDAEVEGFGGSSDGEEAEAVASRAMRGQ